MGRAVPCSVAANKGVPCARSAPWKGRRVEAVTEREGGGMGERGRVVVGRVGERGRVVGVMDQAAAPGTPSGRRTARECVGTGKRGRVVVVRVVVVMDLAQFTFGTWRGPRSEGKTRDGPNGIDVTNKEPKVPCLNLNKVGMGGRVSWRLVTK